MNYIYDILVNFSSYAFDFYDWNTDDKITHIRKVPVIKIKTDDLFTIKNSDVRFSSNFLDKIKNKTEVFVGKNVKNIEYGCLLCDGINVLAIMYKNNKCFKSKLALDEEEEVTDISGRLKRQDIEFNVIKTNFIDEFKTRNQIKLGRKIKSELKKADYETLRFIYYECFNRKENNVNEIIKSFEKEIENSNHHVLDKIQKFFKLLEINH